MWPFRPKYIHHIQRYTFKYELFTFTEAVLSFDSYREFLLYVYNSFASEGKIEEIVEFVKNQTKKAFDFNRNTKEGMSINL